MAEQCSENMPMGKAKKKNPTNGHLGPWLGFGKQRFSRRRMKKKKEDRNANLY